jgi:hypothetical protein
MINEELAELIKPRKRRYLTGNIFKCTSCLVTAVILVVLFYLNSIPSMAVINVAFANGLFSQDLIVESDNPILATWAAAVNRGNFVLCSGFGMAPYDPRKAGEVRIFTPNQWTGGKCPRLKAGDVARVSWRYKTMLGFEKTISYTHKITVSQ